MDNPEEAGAFFSTFLGTKAVGTKADAVVTKKAIAATESFMVALPVTNLTTNNVKQSCAPTSVPSRPFQCTFETRGKIRTIDLAQ
jgi:hypothetical protein